MASLLDLAGYVQKQGELGRQRGEQSRIASLASKAYTAPQADRQSILGQMAQTSPDAAVMQQKQFRQGDSDRMADLSRKAKIFVGMAESGNSQAVASLYPQIAQEARDLGLGDIPLEYSDAFLPGLKKFATILDGDQTSEVGVQSTYVDAQGNRVAILRDGSTRTLGQNAPNNQIIDTGDGFVGVNKSSLSAAPVMMGGGQQAAPQPSLQAGLYQTPAGMVRIGDGLTPEQQQAALADIQAGGTADNVQLPARNVAPQQFGGQQLRSAPKPQALSDLERRLQMADQMGATAEEKRRMVIGGDSGRDAQRISAKDATTARQKLTQIKAARQQLASARQAFNRLKGTFSAGLGGNYLPTPEGQAFDRAIRNLTPLITAVTRVPGVGSMSDYESRLQEASLPSRGTYENVTLQQFQDLENLLNTVEGGYNELLSGGQAAPTAADEETSVDDLLSLYR